MNRKKAISELAKKILTLKKSHPVRVGIDGVDASGKTILADELVAYFNESGREIIRASIDGFHNPGAVRFENGATPLSYFEDSFNYDSLKENLLISLGENGDLNYTTAVFDFKTDCKVNSESKTAYKDAILIFDGVFLHRNELHKFWDFSIFVDADFDVTVSRAQARDQYLFGSAEKAKKIYLERYVPGQKIYLERCNPKEKADVIVVNNNINFPELILNKHDGNS